MKEVENHLKMYILVKDTVPLGLAVNGVAHASLACYLKFYQHTMVDDWMRTSFRKCTCYVTEEEFEQAKLTEDNFVITESDYDNDNKEIVIAFKPRYDWPEHFFNYRLLS